MPLKPQASLRFGDFVLTPQERLLTRAGEAIPIGPKAFDALVILTEGPGILVERATLRERLWPGLTVEETTINRAIADLRKALGEAAENRDYIETVPKFGYRFIAPVERIDAPPFADPLPAPEESPLPEAAESPAAFEPKRRIGRRQVLIVGGCLTVILTAGIIALERRHTAHIQSVLVTPFQVVGAGTQADELAFGLQDSLTTELSSLSGLAVRSVKPDRRLRNGPDDPAELGRQYGADVVLLGTVQMAGGRTRITARLVRIASRQAVWSGTFEEESADLFRIESSLAKQVVTELLPVLSASIIRQIGAIFPAGPAA